MNAIRTADGAEVYENRIAEALDEYITVHGIEDMRKETQSRWNAALIFIYNMVFKNDRYALKEITENGTSRDNAYDLSVVNLVCDYYIALCYEYEKEVSINGFCFLTGISDDAIRGWGECGGTYAERLQSSVTGLAVYKKLKKNNEESLSALLISGKRPPVALLGALNRRHGWNMSQPLQDENRTRQLPTRTAAEIAAGRDLSMLPEPVKPEI